MKPTFVLRRIAPLAAAAALALGLTAFAPTSPATAAPAAPATATAAAADAAQLAAANTGRSAGTCANTPTRNTLGGAQFEHSCVGWAGAPEYWCADFAIWAWRNAGLAVTGLDASAVSFRTYGQNNGTLHTAASYQPQAGDAVIYGTGTGSGTVIHHVGIVTSVGADGAVVTANGDWNGDPNAADEAAFARSSSVVSLTIPAAQRTVGSVPSTVDPAHGYRIDGYITPVTASTANPYTPTQVCGPGFGVIDSHSLGGATAYLLYEASSGRNCVVTLADQPSGAVPMDATLKVQGGAAGANPGSYTYYAGPVTLNAAGTCVDWGGSYRGTTWTSGWSHCG
ncbi:CHAP domain-containing protein [Kitasatospora sp. DSM 101779]|uniref:CHAP domain-containing protein n=1 Tax=Kitasatospora sp. DSM 101779 TaxID=2853165 RepID=UPI0021D7E3EB|nr:CHAP domain-containing protein [Kitasatospora sp. DSM 101779]MCU7822099.1 CHAP domain-containing protein [Kitasatospora sp. DSM 101779]